MVGYTNETRFWDDEFHGWWDDAVQGNSAFQSGLRRQVYVATLSGQPAVCVFSDLEKFYDTVVCTDLPIWHWSGIFQNDCST